MRFSFLVIMSQILFYSLPAYAYLDPGFASMIFQSIAAFFALLISLVSIFYFKIKFYIFKVINFFKKNTKK